MVAQLTVHNGHEYIAIVNAQGRLAEATAVGETDWEQTQVRFYMDTRPAGAVEIPHRREDGDFVLVCAAAEIAAIADCNADCNRCDEAQVNALVGSCELNQLAQVYGQTFCITPAPASAPASAPTPAPAPAPAPVDPATSPFAPCIENQRRMVDACIRDCTDTRPSTNCPALIDSILHGCSIDGVPMVYRETFCAEDSAVSTPGVVPPAPATGAPMPLPSPSGVCEELRRHVQAGGRDGAVPRCTADGGFKAMQCSADNDCWCVRSAENVGPCAASERRALRRRAAGTLLAPVKICASIYGQGAFVKLGLAATPPARFRQSSVTPKEIAGASNRHSTARRLSVRG